ncbi:arylamine N-acetyltransferase 3 [Durotheca rogersii]|uniref:arylamine N-acetyltransferase 3 n=1 Tax=Durotheca rogersii TaxID=419775 RepID=UPI002220D3C4|nr:arylamine N-acetyltransferase 3 [Durotheca rogersii]KAI5859864.1 arylamine N-acetyltransferase 3 [Durotheca rogersii]
MADRPRYSRVQLEQYFDRIGLPVPERHYSVAALAGDDERLAYLSLLKKHVLVRIPFENLAQHYSWHRTVDVRPQHVFDKIIRNHPPARGGYCMEANTLFHTVLLSLGYKVFMAGARVYTPEHERYGGFSHCVNIATIGDQRYMLDVGFGGNGPTGPIPLVAAKEGGMGMPHVRGSPARIRLVRGPIPQQVDQGCEVWIYQHCVDPKEGGKNAEATWTPLYCFVDFEFLPEDIRGMNLSPWRSPTSFFTYRVMLTRFTTNLETDDASQGGGPGQASDRAVSEGEIDGALILFHDTLKWRRGGQTRVEIRLESEAQRIDSMRRYFGIVLAEGDREAIHGTASELK